MITHTRHYENGFIEIDYADDEDDPSSILTIKSPLLKEEEPIFPDGLLIGVDQILLHCNVIVGIAKMTEYGTARIEYAEYNSIYVVANNVGHVEQIILSAFSKAHGLIDRGRLFEE